MANLMFTFYYCLILNSPILNKTTEKPSSVEDIF